MSALQLRISLSLMRLCPCDPGEGWGDRPWFGVEAGVGARVKVFRVHEGKEGPQRLGLIAIVNTENGRIPFNYVGQMMHTWPKTLHTWRHIYWSAIPLNNSWFNPLTKKHWQFIFFFSCLFMVLAISFSLSIDAFFLHCTVTSENYTLCFQFRFHYGFMESRLNLFEICLICLRLWGTQCMCEWGL